MAKEIKGRDVLNIKTVSTNNAYNVEKGHRFEGQTYNLYQFDGVVFTVNSNDEFAKWKDEGILYSASFTEGTRMREIDGQQVEVKTLQLTGCTNINQEKSMARAEREINYFLTEFDPAKVDENLLAQLQSA